MITIPWPLLALLIAAAVVGVGAALYLRGRVQRVADRVLAREMGRPRTHGGQR